MFFRVLFEKYIKEVSTGVGVTILLVVFLSVALHHLGKFETSDEDLWKEDRIERYWTGIKNGIVHGNWEDTYVNDKPGVTISILSGMALPFLPDPRDQGGVLEENGEKLFEKYATENTEIINRGLRIPLIIFTAISLALSGFLLFRWMRSAGMVLLSLAFVALNPVTLGISQILNPDAVLWSSALVSILAFFIVLKTGRWGFAVLSGIFFGIAIASKYTGNLLAVFFTGIYILENFFRVNDLGYAHWCKKTFVQMVSIIGIGYGVFALLIPFVLFHREYFLFGTILSPGMREIIIPFGLVVILLFFDCLIFGAKGIRSAGVFFEKYAKKGTARVLAGAMLLLFLGHIVNAWTGARYVPLNDLRERVELQTGSKGNSKTMLVFSMIGENGNGTSSFVKKMLVQSSYTFFTLPTITVVVLLCGCIFLFIRPKIRLYSYGVFALAVPWVFFFGGLMADVLVNVRYGILLQPILGILAAIFVWEMTEAIRKRRRWMMRLVLGICIIVAQGFSLASIAPHFLNYQNAFLPNKMSFADSWGYGMYEAAMYLNSKPGVENMQVWTDRKAFCRFFRGKCVRENTIDLSRVSPDYFVITRRNVVKKNFFSWKDPESAKYPVEYYYRQAEENPEWKLLIGGRPLNSVILVASQE